jgi:hypothetical protein
MMQAMLSIRPWTGACLAASLVLHQEFAMIRSPPDFTRGSCSRNQLWSRLAMMPSYEGSLGAKRPPPRNWRKSAFLCETRDSHLGRVIFADEQQRAIAGDGTVIMAELTSQCNRCCPAYGRMTAHQYSLYERETRAGPASDLHAHAQQSVEPAFGRAPVVLLRCVALNSFCSRYCGSL